MSGHSKWATIKRKKGATDAQRGKLFSRLAKEITVAARMGGGDPDTNARLRLAVSRARDANMPKDNIERAIKKGTGELDGVMLEEIIYEAYGPGGTSMLINALTDSRNRTISELRYIMERNNGKMADAGSVNWNFDRVGLITLTSKGLSEDDVVGFAIEAGADDVREVFEGNFEIYTLTDDLSEVTATLMANNLILESSNITMVPKTTMKLSGKEAEQMLRLVSLLEDLDDVQNVWANFDISEEEMERIAGEE